MTFSWRLFAVGIAAVLAIASCGGDDQSSSPTSTAAHSDNGSADVGIDDSADGDGGDTPASNAGSLPSGAGEDFPIAIPGGWEIDIHDRAGLTLFGSVQVLYPVDEFDAIVAFYDDWTAQQPLEYSRSTTNTSVLYLVNEPARTINISNDYEEQGNRYTIVQAIAPES